MKYEKVIVNWKCDQCDADAVSGEHEFTSAMRQSQGGCFPDTARITVSNAVMYTGAQDLCVDCQIKLVGEWLKSQGCTVTKDEG